MKRITDQKPEIELRLRIPWDSNTAKGFACALLLLALLALLVELVPLHSSKPTTLPYDVLATIKLGDDDGTGQSKGNLSPEGIKLRATKSSQPLEDAERPATVRTRNTRTKTQPTTVEGGRFNPIARDSRHTPRTRDTATARESSSGSGTTARGDRDGSSSGSGRGTTGSGSGLGLGYGDIEWGGGGSAIVVRKVVPTVPDGLSRSTIVRLRFVVSPEGDVIDIRPVVRGVPEAENAAIRALRQWRFRPLSGDNPVVGIITFRFDIN